VRSLLRHLPAAVAAGVVAGVFLYPLCGLAFRCGCEMMWMAAAEHCNVHRPVGPHCPWCEHAALGTLGFVLTLALQAFAYLYTWRRSRSAIAAGFAALLTLPAAAVLAAFLTWLPTDYPHFLVYDVRPRLGLPDGPVRCVRP
jgi:hypothetical protein